MNYPKYIKRLEKLERQLDKAIKLASHINGSHAHNLMNMRDAIKILIQTAMRP